MFLFVFLSLSLSGCISTLSFKNIYWPVALLVWPSYTCPLNTYNTFKPRAVGRQQPSLASLCATQGEFAENFSKNLLATLSTTTPPPVFLKLLLIREHLCNFSTTLFIFFCYDKVVQFGDFPAFGQGIGYTERSLEKSSTPRSNVISRTSSLKCNVPWTNSWLPTCSIVYRK